MKIENIRQHTQDFESISKTLENWVEFWFARDLQKILWYKEWRNFLKVIEKAKTTIITNKEEINHHFVEVNKTIQMPKNATKDIPDIMLSRYACYFIAMNWDSRKEEISFAQKYFAIATRKLEIIEQRILEIERLQAREKLKHTEKELSEVIFEQTKSDKNFAMIRSKWDKALFWLSTAEMKKRWWVSISKPLADFMPTILLKAKDFATEITIYNAKNQNMNTERQISEEHITNNRSVRKTLIERWIQPENILPEEDTEKVKRRIKSEEKKIHKLSKNDRLNLE